MFILIVIMLSKNKIPYPSIGSGYGSDYDPVKKEFTVPIVFRNELLQKGGNYIETFPPPRIELNTGRTYVLVTHETLDAYGVESRGMFTIQTKNNNSLQLPYHKHTDMSSDIKYTIVSQYTMAARGLLNSTKLLPRFTLVLADNKVMTTFYVVSPAMTKRHNLASDGEFIFPLLKDIQNGPYPLSLKTSEHFAIPPKPKEIEFAQGIQWPCSIN